MATPRRIEIKNARRLMRKFRAMPEEIRKDIARTLDEAGQTVAEEMHRRAPASQLPGDAGHMRDHIDWKLNRSGTSVKIGLFGRLYAKVFFYARFLEFGTRKMTARKFVHPALLAHQNEILSNVETATNDALLRTCQLPLSDA